MITIKLADNAPHWHAQAAVERANDFAEKWPDRRGRNNGVLYHVTRGDECATVYVWRTNSGEIKAEIAVAEPLAEV